MAHCSHTTGGGAVIAAALLATLICPADGTSGRSDAVVLAQVAQSGDVVIPPESLNRVEEIVPKGKDVVIVGGWGFGDGIDLTLLFNTFASTGPKGAVPEGTRERAAGFYFQASPQPPAVWLLNSGKHTPDGKAILLMPCFYCDEAENSTVLFDFIARASHHIVFSSIKVTRGRAQSLAYHLRHTMWVGMLTDANTTALEIQQGDEQQQQQQRSAPPMTWTYLGQQSDAKVAALREMLVEEKVAQTPKGVRVLPRPIPFASTDDVVSGTAPPLASLKEAYRGVACAAVMGAAGEARDFTLRSALVYPFLKKTLQDISNNQVAGGAPDMELLLRDSLEERKADALEMYRMVLQSVAEGDRVWIKKVTQAQARPALLLDGLDPRDVSNGLVQAVRGVLSTEGEGAVEEAFSALAVSPASQSEFLTGAKQAWILSLGFFTGGFTSLDEDVASVTRTDLRAEIAKEKDRVRAHHTSRIKEYLENFSKLLTEAVVGYFPARKVPDICSPEVEEVMWKDLTLGVERLFEQPNNWWPTSTYDSVSQAEARVKKTIETLRETRAKKAAVLIAEKMKAVGEENLNLLKQTCALPEDGSPAKSVLRELCSSAVSSALDHFDAIGDKITEGECAGRWVRANMEFLKARRTMEKALVALKDSVLKENDAILATQCRVSMEEELEAVATAFSAIEMHECPDEDDLDKASAEHKKTSPQRILKRWAEWQGPVIDTCIADMDTRINEELQSVKTRIEHKLFGAEEVRQWRADWWETLPASLAECTLCKFHSYFLHGHLHATAEETAPKTIGGNTVSPGFRAGLIKRAVKQELAEKNYTAEYEILTYTAIFLVIGGLVVVFFV